MVEASTIFDDSAVEGYLRRRGLAGPITTKFLKDIRWSIFGSALADALTETGIYPCSVEGAQAFMDDILAIDSPAKAKDLPEEHPVRVVGRRLAEIASARLADGPERSSDEASEGEARHG